MVLVDDHEVVRDGFARWLELSPDFCVVGQADNGKSAYNLLRDVQADLIVMDMSMPGWSGLETLHRLLGRDTRLKVVIYSMHCQAVIVRQMLAAGASGYVSKSSSPKELLDVMRQAVRGEQGLSADIHTALLQSTDAFEDRLNQLSPREFEIFQSLIAGRSLDVIANTLNISPKTAANYQTAIRQKLGVQSDIEMVRLALMAGIVN